MKICNAITTPNEPYISLNLPKLFTKNENPIEMAIVKKVAKVEPAEVMLHFCLIDGPK